MAQVGIVMGSDSDMPIMAKAADILDQLGVSYKRRIKRTAPVAVAEVEEIIELA